ncbi:MAG: hypothetical protein J6V04_01950 [Bacteroidales bacterium]|nr:hypothetical protein [Bacteroidales bacterium]MBO7322473.1 hypothetical protein [Bacteroidales bacterium]
MKYDLLPEGVDTDIVLNWESDDEDVATVENGTIEAISVGETFQVEYKLLPAEINQNLPIEWFSNR